VRPGTERAQITAVFPGVEKVVGEIVDNPADHT
jgi:hypothetical protein